MTSDRKERARQRRLDTARELEGRGHISHAVDEYLKAKAPGEAARVLAKVGRLADAGAAIVKGLKIDERGVAPLSAADRELVKQAVSFFDAGHEGAKAQKLREALEAAPPPPAQDESPPDDATAVDAPSREVSKSAPTRQPAPETAEPPKRRSAQSSGSFRPPIKKSGSFRPPSTSSGSFRPPSSQSGSFRPPSSKSGSFKPPSRESGTPQPPSSKSGSFKPPSRESGTSQPPSSKSGSFKPPSSKSGSFKPNTESGSFRAPKISSVPPSQQSSAPVRHAIHPGRRVSTPAPRPAADPLQDARKQDAREASTKAQNRASAPPRDSTRPRRSTPRSMPPGPKKSKPKLSASGGEISEYSGNRASGWRGAGDEALERSIEEHVEAGRKGAAARIARDAGQFGRALAWFEELNLHSQAGACLRSLGRPVEALAMLLREEAVGPTYRKACFEIVAIAVELNAIDFDTDRFLAKFVADGPADRDEVKTYFDLAKLYVAHEFEGAAKRCLRKVLEHEPEHLDAKDLDKDLRRRHKARTSSSPGARVIGLAATARGLPPLPTMKEFVELARAHKPAE